MPIPGDEPDRDELEQESVEQRPLVTIKSCGSLQDALFARGRLDSAEIESFLLNENIVRLDWFLVNAVGGIKLQVEAEDVETALALLDHPYLVPSDEPEE